MKRTVMMVHSPLVGHTLLTMRVMVSLPYFECCHDNGCHGNGDGRKGRVGEV